MLGVYGKPSVQKRTPRELLISQFPEASQETDCSLNHKKKVTSLYLTSIHYLSPPALAEVLREVAAIAPKKGSGTYSPPSVEYGVYGDLILLYPKTYSIYLRGTTGFAGDSSGEHQKPRGALLYIGIRGKWNLL